MAIGRNAPCFCGSGKKYKKCCGVKNTKELIYQSEVVKAKKESRLEQLNTRLNINKDSFDPLAFDIAHSFIMVNNFNVPSERENISLNLRGWSKDTLENFIELCKENFAHNVIAENVEQFSHCNTEIAIKASSLCVEANYYKEASVLLHGRSLPNYFSKLLYCLSLFKIGNYNESLLSAKVLVEQNIDSNIPFLIYARSLFKLGQYEFLADFLPTVIEKDPLVLGGLLIRSYFKLNRLDEGITLSNLLISKGIAIRGLALEALFNDSKNLDEFTSNRFLGDDSKDQKLLLFNLNWDQHNWNKEWLDTINLNEFSSLPGNVMNSLYENTLESQITYFHNQSAQAIESSCSVKSGIKIPSKKKKVVGFVSSDFKRHSVAYFLLPLFKEYSRENFRFICYHNTDHVDDITREFMQLSDSFVFVENMSTETLLFRIQIDKVDVLFDLSGYTSGNRLDVFAARAAPVQITWLGYPYSTALRNMDYRLVDDFTDPVGQKEEFLESLIRLKRLFLVFERPQDIYVDKGNHSQVRLGSFNNLSKVTDNTIRLWAQILAEIKNSTLCIKSKHFKIAKVRLKVIQKFLEYGISKERLILLDRLEKTEHHLDFYNSIDIALDTYPYNGVTTTCEALWMGTPVITLLGETHRSRVCGAILNSVGLEELITISEKDYVSKCVSLAKDKKKLRAYNDLLRDKLLNSELMDAKSFREHFEDMLNNITNYKHS